MFEKYPFVHCDVTDPLTANTGDRIEASLERTLSSPGSSLPTGEAYSDLSSEMRGARYCITGSFDFLLPPVTIEASASPVPAGLEVQMFLVMDSTPAYFTHRDFYESLMLSYTYAGKGQLLYEGKTYDQTPGTGFLIDCRKPQEYRTTGDHWQHADLHLWGRRGDDLCRCAAQNGLVLFSLADAAYTRLMEEFLDAYIYFSDLHDLYVEDALAHLFFSVLKSAEKEGVSRIPLTYKYMIRYMESNYMRPLSLDDLSELFHVSKYHLSREFRRYTSHSPMEYLITLRTNHALLLLAQSDLSVERIALESGFSNMSNFIAQIKKKTGLTPSAFRKYVRA